MALVVEDGTGITGADSYASVVDFDAHAAAWGFDLTGKTTAQKEVALRQAAAFVDTIGRFKAARLVSTQSLEFPRSGLVDWSGIEVLGVPERVKRAAMDLAFKAMSGPLQEDLARGGKILSESVGPISVTYAADAPTGTTYTLATKLLEPYLRIGETDISAPLWNDEVDPTFDVGMHDHPGDSR